MNCYWELHFNFRQIIVSLYIICMLKITYYFIDIKDEVFGTMDDSNKLSDNTR